jgi:hypothetical protein
MDWPEFSPTQRLRLAALLRPDLPVGIAPTARTVAEVGKNRAEGAP